MMAALLFFTVSAFAQASGFQTSNLEFSVMGGGARAAGMGDAYLGVAEGEMSYSWNPAAMVWTDKTKLGFQLASISDKFDSPDIRLSNLYTDPNIRSVENKKEHFSLNYGGFTVPFEFMDREWAVGGGYRNVFDLISEFKAPGFNNSLDEYTQNRGVDAASVAFAWRMMPEISVGLTINAYIRNSELNHYLGASEQYVAPNGVDTSIVDSWLNINSHFGGANVDLGLAADFGMFKGGFVFHTPYTLTQNVKRTYSIIIPPQPIGAIDRVKYSYNMPASFSLGLAAVPMEKLTLDVDFFMAQYSSVDVKSDWEQVIFTDTTVSANWEDFFQFRIGAEYMLDAGFADVPVRAGFRSEPSTGKQFTSIAYDDSTGEWGAPVYGSQVTTNIIALGTGLHFDKIWFDLAYQFGSSSYDTKIDYNGVRTFENKKDYSRVILSTGMYF